MQTVFFHIPKAAGTTAINYLTQYASNSIRFPMPFYHQKPNECLKDYNFVAGHFSHEFMNYLNPDRFIFTFLRPPIELTTSFFYFNIKRAQNDDPYYIHLKKLSSLEILAKKEYIEDLGNRATRQLMNNVPLKNYSMEEIVDQCVEKLIQFQFIGFQNQFQQDFNQLCHLLNISAPLENKKQNAYGEPTMDILKQEEQVDVFLERFEEINQYDLALYERIIKMKNQKQLPQDLNDYTQYNFTFSADPIDPSQRSYISVQGGRYIEELEHQELLNKFTQNGFPLRRTFAQKMEDVWVERIFKDKNQGFYIDVGAYDPNLLSVTKKSYDQGWHGINIEPIIQNHQKFVAQRIRDINLNIAVSDTEGTLPFYVVKGNHHHAGAHSSFDKENVEKICKQYQWDYETRHIPVQTLTKICDEYCAKGQEIDFLKVDVEGFEAQVLQGMDFQKYRPKLLIIEATLPTSNPLHVKNIEDIETWSSFEPYLFENGYVFQYFDGINRYYLAQEYVKETGYLFQVPIGNFDGYDYIMAQNIALKGLELAKKSKELIPNSAFRRQEQIKKLNQNLAQTQKNLVHAQKNNQQKQEQIKNLNQHLVQLQKNLAHAQQNNQHKQEQIKNLNQNLISVQQLNTYYQSFFSSKSWNILSNIGFFIPKIRRMKRWSKHNAKSL